MDLPSSRPQKKLLQVLQEIESPSACREAAAPGPAQLEPPAVVGNEAPIPEGHRWAPLLSSGSAAVSGQGQQGEPTRPVKPPSPWGGQGVLVCCGDHHQSFDAPGPPGLLGLPCSPLLLSAGGGGAVVFLPLLQSAPHPRPLGKPFGTALIPGSTTRVALCPFRTHWHRGETSGMPFMSPWRSSPTGGMF